MKYILFISLFIVGVLSYSCAVQKAPLGGKKDETPPQLDSMKSTPNYLTNFDLEKVVLRFDEFIELKNAFEQVVYSPPMKVKPELVQRGKKITIKFSKEDTLRANTTYTINFGEAIVDLNEGNPMKNFRYVFSTGDVIDSLSIRGRVMDDMTSEAAEEVLVFLYDKYNDSIVYEEQPYYFARTDESGNFSIENLRSDSFKVVVLKDENLNLKYDLGEAIGFLDSLIYTTDSTPPPLALNIFQPRIPIELLDEEFSPFKMRFHFSESPDSITLGNLRDSVYWVREINKDSLILWHDNSVPNDTFYILGDTISYKRRVSKAEVEPLKYKKKNLSRQGTLPPETPIELEFAYAISEVDTTKFELSDSLVRTIRSLKLDSLNPRKIQIDYTFRFGDTMALYMEPGALTFINGASNDTITELVIPESPEKYGILYLTIDSLDAEKQYVMQLMDSDREVERRIIKDKAQEKFSFKLLPPKTYDVRLTLDENRNGRWDPGSYWEKTQSEIWQSTKLEALRENWELESNVEWKR